MKTRTTTYEVQYKSPKREWAEGYWVMDAHRRPNWAYKCGTPRGFDTEKEARAQIKGRMDNPKRVYEYRLAKVTTTIEVLP